MNKLSKEEKFYLITRNLKEILGSDDLRNIIDRKDPSVYWGTATTGKPHIAYFLPLLKIKDFIDAGCEVKILLADIHAFLDNLKANFDEIDSRTEYYKLLITETLKMLNVTKGFTLVKGSDFQTGKNYTLDLYKICSLTSERDARKAGASVVKQLDNPLISSLIYPSMQALDEEYLDVDIQFGGLDQRKIFTYAMKYLPKLGYKKRIHLMNFMVPGLNGDKMSASDINSKIDFMDDEKTIKNKIKKCFCEEGNIDTGLLPLLKHVIFPVFNILGKRVMIKCEDGKELEFGNYEMLEKIFVERKVHPLDLKIAIGEMLNVIVEPVRKEMMKHSELVKKAYKK
ncbi:tyrosine-tRNA ligase [Vavraia culicis subsp. floridensis]|uniref:Tyrosine--tRNA ligase n=1 Tax=Vavraia culicis (isolate floridensis) TaxID=948595 RepID=L2GV13_VAVCU|nr:tyrosine-tRNA ligase [Vavraia culicis subsp. floridensis]ELA47212.1 tyrosine-tRNA ligase [Vavraia culicis subsp. floridensis]